MLLVLSGRECAVFYWLHCAGGAGADDLHLSKQERALDAVADDGDLHGTQGGKAGRKTYRHMLQLLQ